MRITQVDAFTDRPLAGNPAAVCVLEEPAPEAWMQGIATEMNVSETAFLHPEGGGWRLRWFTPAVEVDLCGHATLAAAHVLWEEGHLNASETARFETRSGLLTARREAGQETPPGPPWIILDFPAEPAEATELPAGLAGVLGLASAGARVVFAGRNRFDLIVEVTSPNQSGQAIVRALKPDLTALARLPYRGVIVTAVGDGIECDFVSRFFAPAVGVPEDPVTGSAHCCLGPYWGERLRKSKLVGRQVSARGGVVKVSLVTGEGVHRVLLGGQAVTVLRGVILPVTKQV